MRTTASTWRDHGGGWDGEIGSSLPAVVCDAREELFAAALAARGLGEVVFLSELQAAAVGV